VISGKPAVRARRRQAGFTLIEMIVVLAIMGLIGLLVLVRQPLHSAGLDTEATVRALTSALQGARSRAIVQDRDVTVVTNSVGFAVDGGAVWKLPQNETFSAAQVVFAPDGGSSGTTIVLAAGPRRITVSVNWLTGRVHSGELRDQ
jgi:general secretion pathway protein H